MKKKAEQDTRAKKDKFMEKTVLLSSSNISNPVFLLLKGARKRRSLAKAKAKIIQGDLNIVPRLTTVT